MKIPKFIYIDKCDLKSVPHSTEEACDERYDSKVIYEYKLVTTYNVKLNKETQETYLSKISIKKDS